MEIKEILRAQKKFTDKSIIVNGWVKNRRGSKNVFLSLLMTDQQLKTYK